MKKIFKHLTLYFILLTNLISCGAIAEAVIESAIDSATDTESSEADTRTPTERSNALALAINNYRVENGLSAIPLSASLTAVAQAHVQDLQDNNPNTGTCNMHSWSSDDSWTDCCYTADHAQAQCMWDKPSELSSNVYTSNGYEITATNTTVSASQYLTQWKGSEPHHNVILNLDTWVDVEFLAMGAAMSDSYGVVWFGEITDPAGLPEE